MKSYTFCFLKYLCNTLFYYKNEYCLPLPADGYEWHHDRSADHTAMPEKPVKHTGCRCMSSHVTPVKVMKQLPYLKRNVEAAYLQVYYLQNDRSDWRKFSFFSFQIVKNGGFDEDRLMQEWWGNYIYIPNSLSLLLLHKVATRFNVKNAGLFSNFIYCPSTLRQHVIFSLLTASDTIKTSITVFFPLDSTQHICAMFSMKPTTAIVIHIYPRVPWVDSVGELFLHRFSRCLSDSVE